MQGGREGRRREGEWGKDQGWRVRVCASGRERERARAREREREREGGGGGGGGGGGREKETSTERMGWSLPLITSACRQ